MKNLRTFDQFVNESKDERENLNEAFEWWHPVVSLATAIGSVASAMFIVMGPGWILNPQAIAPGDTWPDVYRHFRDKLKDKRTAKRLTKEDALGFIRLLQTNIDAPGGIGQTAPGVKRYLKGLMNKVEKELNKNENEVDKDKLLLLLRDVQNYAKGHKVDISDIKILNESALNEWTDSNFSGKELLKKDLHLNGYAVDLFKKYFPKGVKSEKAAVDALKKHDASRIKQKMGNRFAPMFVHVQYHEINDGDAKYRVHQTQYYNSNYDDIDPDFNPGVTVLVLTDLETNDTLGNFLVKTGEYVKDLQDLRRKRLLGERVS